MESGGEGYGLVVRGVCWAERGLKGMVEEGVCCR